MFNGCGASYADDKHAVQNFCEWGHVICRDIKQHFISGHGSDDVFQTNIPIDVVCYELIGWGIDKNYG